MAESPQDFHDVLVCRPRERDDDLVDTLAAHIVDEFAAAAEAGNAGERLARIGLAVVEIAAHE